MSPPMPNCRAMGTRHFGIGQTPCTFLPSLQEPLHTRVGTTEDQQLLCSRSKPFLSLAFCLTTLKENPQNRRSETFESISLESFGFSFLTISRDVQFHKVSKVLDIRRQVLNFIVRETQFTKFAQSEEILQKRKIN